MRPKAFNLIIPSHLHETWESTTGPEGHGPIRASMYGDGKYKKYQYGVRAAVEKAHVLKTDFKKMFSWLVGEKCQVDCAKWMKDLRNAGLGNCSRGKNVDNIAKMQAVIRNWVGLFNKHHKTDQIQFQTGIWTSNMNIQTMNIQFIVAMNI